MVRAGLRICGRFAAFAPRDRFKWSNNGAYSSVAADVRQAEFVIFHTLAGDAHRAHSGGPKAGVRAMHDFEAFEKFAALQSQPGRHLWFRSHWPTRPKNPVRRAEYPILALT